MSKYWSHFSGNGGGLNGSTQHFLAVYSQESENLRFVVGVVSDIVLRGFLDVEKKGHSAANTEVILTPRENEILRPLAGGKSNKEISAALGITVRTVETHRAKIMLKLDLHSIAELIH